MRKTICLMLFLISCSLTLVACGGTDTEIQKDQFPDTETVNQDNDESKTEDIEGSISDNSSESNILVAYFSWADNAEQGDIDAITSASVTVPGNVAQFAAWIADEINADLFSIQVSDPYPSDWDACLERANQEIAENVRPELVQTVENMEDYDVVFLGYPNWWYSCPMAILSFIEENDFSGKQVYLFCSHGTGGLARSVQDITDALPECNISENVFDAYEEDTLDSRNEIEEWLRDIGY